MATPKMLVVDLDGTTLNAERQIADIDRRAADLLHEAQIPVTIATGRLYTGTDWVAHALGIEGTVAVMNGSEIVDLGTEQATHGSYFGADERRAAREILARYDLATFLFQSRQIRYGSNHHRYASYLNVWTERLDAHPDLFDAEPWEQSHDLLAIGLLGPGPSVLAAQRDLLEQIAGATAFAFPTPGGETFLKLRFGEEDKGTAIARLASDRGFLPSEVVAVGDWVNDVPMLKAAGRSFAMAHAREDVRAAAGEVLVASREGGAIAEIAKRVWGIEA